MSSEMLKMKLPERIEVERCPLNWAQWVAREFHYLRREVHVRADPFAYRVLFDGCPTRPDGKPCGMIMFATVHFTKQRGMFGYDRVELRNGRTIWSEDVDQGETADVLGILEGWVANHPECSVIHTPGLTKWQVLVLSRVWLHDDLPHNSETVTLAKIWRRIQRDWLEHHPPVYPELPYHIRLILSWCDTSVGHTGALYRAANFKEIKRTWSRPRHGKDSTRGSGEEGELIQFAHWLKEPRWEFGQQMLFANGRNDV